MKQKKIILALVLTLLCGITIGANASNGLQTISAYLNANITVKLDGEAQTFLDANGSRVYPITYNGTTYLPVRAVAGLVGLDVEWDQATQTVLLGKTKGVDLIDTYKCYFLQEFQQVQSVDKADSKDISGVSYSHWLYVHGAPRGVSGVASFNLAGKFNTVTFTYYANTDVTLQVLGDNESVLAEIPIKGGAVAQTITVNLLGTSQLTFKNVEEMGRDAQLYIVNTILD